ncbi:MAG TPA: squalene synthase HpnC [Candidatus Acidoferrales bacterium]|nr:squalene synthase HpnC [Candidatus Acidoferrales bacterium]
MLPTPELEIARNLPAEGCSPEEAQRYTRWLATHHYENFNVVSWLLPRRLHQHFYNVYAYCRWADDLGDEVPDHERALALLDAWEAELRLCYGAGTSPTHPVLIALRETIREKDIPIQPFSDLLKAFRQDQRVQRYANWDEVVDYCVYSANPVGRLVLYVCGYRDEERQRLSDYTCTALQLANFWQDVSRDLEKGRIYIPLDAIAAHGLTENDIVGRRFDSYYIALMKDLIGRTRELFAAGLPLAQRVDSTLRADIELFSRGGMWILDAIEEEGYDTLNHRPELTDGAKVSLLARAAGGRLWSAAAKGVGETVNWAKSRGSSRRSQEDESAASGVKTTEEEAILLSDLKPATADRVRPPKNHFGDVSERRSSAGLKTGNDEVVRESYAECGRVSRAAHSSFYMAFFGLPKPKRNALCALYAFNRLVDNVSDEPGDLESKRRGLARWRAMLDEAVAGKTDGHAILPALADTISRFAIPTRYFHDLILGAEMDLTIASYATFDQLSEYCYRVAGTVGLTCVHVFGFSDPKVPDLAERLGLAFQLTNIIRDVRSDFEMGRVYLPEEDLERFRCRKQELQGPSSAPLRELLAFEADRAWNCYEEGATLISKIDADSRATLWALVRTYSSLLARIEERDFDVFSSRISVSSAEKLRYLLMAGTNGWWKKDALAISSRGRRRTGGTVLRRRAG